MHTLILTGASDGIGAEMARQLSQAHGSQLQLVLAARSTDKLQAVARQCEAHGTRTLVVPTDVADEAQCRALIERTLAAFGGIDTLVNNAGVSAHAQFSDVCASNLGWYERLMRINLWGSVWCTHAALPHLVASRGRIVAVSSLAGLIGVPGRTAYSATKFAMGGFFEALRTEIKPSGVSVTLAYPGVVDTRIRYHGYNARGEAAGVSGLKEDHAMPVAEAARLIVRGMDRREREVVMTARGKLGRWLKLIAPGWVENLAIAAVKEGARPGG